MIVIVWTDYLSAQKSSRSPHRHDDSSRALPQTFSFHGLFFWSYEKKKKKKKKRQKG